MEKKIPLSLEIQISSIKFIRQETISYLLSNAMYTLLKNEARVVIILNSKMDFISHSSEFQSSRYYLRRLTKGDIFN